ncbi:UDP-N-acetylmuramate--L-alanine ligase [Alphaproteobacteria bacterium]|nr:UDP-N-acetylmuramate--L-alanine ligase [Alphaproteobacteria bacterium]MDA8624776.1 UDP-N-acetylmuramate--L-alanine ligase [Alphaproteobacteria bacterium]MDB2393439.1 UDP-N-acetylmuramate--L-alanine ligase [Alphaproteobacteria bacterium]MDB2406227.1 UDP-N-acetylmuramate--L-alanine ligase [Alphaproteobacteria bacterium]MDB2462031.1 UDP-N-acetylmuramate--L-alanine ligase [Alphaproteobacteria bacterium]
MDKATTMPSGLRSFGRVHIVGIGGIGMSGIAEVMHVMGYEVQGSDLGDNANTQRLRDMGIDVAVGHAAENVAGAGVVTVSSAVQADNLEVIAARENHIPVVRRAEMLAELMRLKPCITIAGTHGKTTTTSLTAAILDAAGLDPTVINGGIINAYGTNARLGQGDWMVVEADESDGTFVRLPATIGIVTNIDPEHLDHYGDFDGLRAAFDSYIANIPFYGVGIVCLDHAEVQALVGRVTDRRLITYGLSEQADIRAVNIREDGLNQHFDILYRDRRNDADIEIKKLCLPMAGKHNLQNALAAIAAGLELGATADTIASALKGFGGVKRRFSSVGEVEQGIRIFDDYAHHPVEIEAVLESARAVTSGRVVAVMQPHRYTRLRDLFSEFCACMNGADTVLVLPVYAAGEPPIDGIDSAALAEGLCAHGHRHVISLAQDQDLPDALADILQKDDVVICMGAGSISQLAYRLPEKLEGRL